MSKRTRYFLVGSVAFLVIGLSIGLVAYYNGGLQGLTNAGGPDQLRYVPNDAAVVAYANVQQIMSSDFRQRMKQLQPQKNENGQKEFRDETGIDIEKDINNVVAYMTANQATGTKGGVVIANGRFDENRIENLVKSKGGTAGDYRGKRFMTFATREAKPEGAGALAFLRGDLVAVGNADAVKRSIDLGEGQGVAIKSNDKMEALIRDVAPKGNAWVVGRFDVLSNQAHLPEQVASRIPPISWFSAAGQIDGGVAAALTVETINEDAAKNLAMVIEGLKGLAGLQAGANAAQMREALQSFGVAQNGSQLTVSFRLPSELIYGLAAQGRKPADSK